MSRHQIGVATPLSPPQVATSKRGRDTVSPAQPPSQVATSFFQVATFWSFTYVATSFPCHDLVPAHSGTPRSRHRNPCRDLPHCRPCRDIKFMSRRRFRPAKADQVTTPLPGRDLTLLLKASSMSQPRLTSPSLNQTRSQPQTWVATQHWNLAVAIPASALHQIFFFSNPPVAFLLLLRCSSLNTAIHTTSNIFIKIILFNLLQFYPIKP